MKYYVVADVHGFFSALMTALKEQGYFEDETPHKLVVLGDLFDRGKEAVALQEFIVDLIKKEEVILIRGNHEDLTKELIENAEQWFTPAVYTTHHYHNRTVDAVLQLTGYDLPLATLYPERVRKRMQETPYFKTIMPAMRDYFETENYIFVHGWIPCSAYGYGGKYYRFEYRDGWRKSDRAAWERARWYNGMLAASQGVTEGNKRIVCGHFHCSYGHAILEGTGSEFDKDADFSPYRADGVLAIDACTACSGKINCIVLED